MFVGVWTVGPEKSGILFSGISSDTIEKRKICQILQSDCGKNEAKPSGEYNSSGR